MSTTTIKNELWELVRAGFSGIWVETQEPNEVVLDVAEMCGEKQLRLLAWNIDTGLRSVGSDADAVEIMDPLAAVRTLSTFQSDQNTLLILENFHRFIDSPTVCQAVLTQLQIGKQLGRHMIILAPVIAMPVELERHFTVLSPELPSREKIWDIAASLSEEELPSMEDSDRRQLLDAAVGLTSCEVESALSLSLVRHGQFSVKEIWDLKSRWLKSSGMLELHRGSESAGFEKLGGLQSLKSLCIRSLRHKSDASRSRAKPRGVMLLGVPGTGKSAFAKALASETGRPLLALDVGQLLGSLVGQSEENLRTALRTADSMAPCILFIDEVEKALSGASSQGLGDSGVSSRILGTLLTWLNDHESEVYVVVTCNNIQGLPPEFSRAERFDATLFLDLPGRSEKDTIWQMYLADYELPTSQALPSDESWTGAEIKACCRLANLLELTLREAAEYIVPVGVTAAEDIDQLRNWASGRCLDGSRPGLYRKPKLAVSPKSTRRRGITISPSKN